MQRIAPPLSFAAAVWLGSVVLASEPTAHLPRIISAKDAASSQASGPKMYYFDVGRPAGPADSRDHESSQSQAASIAEHAESDKAIKTIAKPSFSPAEGSVRRGMAALPSSRSSSKSGEGAAGTTLVLPAIAISGDAQPAALRVVDEPRPIGDEPPKTPPYDLPPPVEEAPLLTMPFDHGPLPWQMGYLGGIPTFTHDYCPRYWGDPWHGYCAERWREYYGTPCHCPCECGETCGDDCGDRHQAIGEAPIPEPNGPSRPPQAPLPPLPADEHQDTSQQTAEPGNQAAPPHRRPPRNELPKPRKQ
jgi:hypothetical protein